MAAQEGTRRLVLQMGISVDGIMATHDYAAPMNEIPKVVFSKTLERADWPESPIARGELAAEVMSLKREPGKDIVAWGGGSFAQALARLGLVGEYRGDAPGRGRKRARSARRRGTPRTLK
jgi:dihydrofolate reductase